jgi:4-hydroxy-tetrahydrodipicolinate reductase
MVIGTTGWHDRIDDVRQIVEESGIGLVYASNFSLGVNLFYRLIETAGHLFHSFDQYGPYILEAHHQFKKDAPSGTAYVIRDLLQKDYQEADIPISSIRAGYIPGTHSVGFDSSVDSIKLTHSARSREGFVMGALLAIKWISKHSGFYEFKDILNELIKEGGSPE